MCMIYIFSTEIIIIFNCYVVSAPQHISTFVVFISNNIAWNILAMIESIRYIKNTEVHFVGYLFIMGLITTCISVKHTCTSFLPMLMCLWCGCRSVTQNSVSVKVLNECQLFSSVCCLTVNCEESDCSLLSHIVCFFMWRYFSSMQEA